MSKALLLLHGFLTCTDDWDELLPRLQPLYDEVVLFKQPGHERKGEKTHYNDFTEQAVFEALDKQIEYLKKYDSVDVAGHSMGGGAAVYVCAKLDNVRKAILYAPAFKYPRADILLKYNDYLKKIDKLRRACADEELLGVLDRRVEVISEANASALDIFFKRLLPNWSLRNIFTFAKIMRTASEYLPKVKCPLCVMWGDLDEFIPYVGMKYVMEQVSSKEIYFLRYPDADHAIMYLGDVETVITDTLCYLQNGELLNIATERGAARMCYKIAKGEAGSKYVTVTYDERGVDKNGGTKAFCTKRTETYMDGGSKYFASLSGHDGMNEIN